MERDSSQTSRDIPVDIRTAEVQNYLLFKYLESMAESGEIGVAE